MVAAYQRIGERGVLQARSHTENWERDGSGGELIVLLSVMRRLVMVSKSCG